MPLAGNTNLPIGQIFLNLLSFRVPQPLALPVTGQYHFVAPHDRFIAEAETPGLARCLQLFCAKPSLYPPIKFKDAVGVLPDRAEHLKGLGGMALIERQPSFRERKVLIMERVQHVNRIKGLLFSQGAPGYEPLHRDRRARLDALQTGDGRHLPQHLKAQICRELDRLELVLEQIKAAEAERDALLNAEQNKVSAPPPMLLGVHGIGPEFASVLWSEGLSRHFDNRRQVAAYAGLAPTPWQSGSVNREQGISGYEPLRRDRRERLEELQTGDGRRLPQHLKAQVDRELDRLELLLKQIKTVEGERDALLAAAQTAMPAPAAMLLDIKGIGSEFAAVLWSEGLLRHFDNRRQVAAYAGLAPTPWQSGAVDREQGVSKAGNPRLRTTLIQLAWLWLRNQPQSALTIWFHERVRRNAGRLRKTTIVALARKLLVALWKYVTTGVVIKGATMKAA